MSSIQEVIINPIAYTKTHFVRAEFREPLETPTTSDFLKDYEHKTWKYLWDNYIGNRMCCELYKGLIFDAYRLGFLNKMNSSSILKGELEYEFERVFDEYYYCD